ncbi:hypothetical protein GCM10009827_057110 [Dactylosporangium maewongense]|uniref:Uncharacterized protein n=1 Tax=Dactylosporangium maewongense TaxID=634393 RepID=A0ABN2B349_9ACTN
MAAAVKFWINAFIPTAVCQDIGGTEAAVVQGTFPGTPFPSTWFLAGDQRSFSDDIDASARLHSEVEIGGLDTGTPDVTFEMHRCGESRALDADGNVIEVGVAPTTDMAFFNLRRNQTVDPEGGVIDDDDNPNLVQIDVSGSGRVPFSVAPFVPSIDYVGTLSFDPDSKQARFRGGIDGFPAYEIYVTVDGGTPVPVGAFSANNPFELFGDATKHVDVSVTVP